MAKWVTGILLGFFCFLQLNLWVGRGSIQEALKLHQQLVSKTEALEKLAQHNRILESEVEALKRHPDALEERARCQLGMIKLGETFFLVLEPSSDR